MPDDRLVWVERIAGVRRWTRAGERAPHKPLLLLYALGRLQRTGSSEMAYESVEADLDALLQEFGPPRATSPAYPFHHLQSDGLWQVEASGTSGPSRSAMRRSGARGRLAPELEAALTRDPTLVVLAAQALLDGDFAPSLHDELCRATGLDLAEIEAAAGLLRVRSLRRRDPRFRDEVLVAYEQRCAMCGYDGRVGGDAVGLDAAHVRWWAFDGPDELANALCLCTLHHKLLDRGVLGLTPDGTVAVSDRFVGSGEVVATMVLDLVDRPIGRPQAGREPPAGAHIGWHARQVFRGAPRRRAA